MCRKSIQFTQKFKFQYVDYIRSNPVISIRNVLYYVQTFLSQIVWQDTYLADPASSAPKEFQLMIQFGRYFTNLMKTQIQRILKTNIASNTCRNHKKKCLWRYRWTKCHRRYIFEVPQKNWNIYIFKENVVFLHYIFCDTAYIFSGTWYIKVYIGIFCDTWTVDIFIGTVSTR